MELFYFTDKKQKTTLNVLLTTGNTAVIFQ